MPEGLSLILASVAAVLGSELVLQRRRVQSALPAAAAVFGLCAAASVWWDAPGVRPDPLCLLVYWSGAFLAWFAVRSHVESSILLRMLWLLSRQPMNGAELVAAYEQAYGLEARLHELLGAGLVEKTEKGLRLTRRGQWVLRAAEWLR